MYVIKRKLKFEDYKHCLEATQLENETKKLEKNTFYVDRENYKEFTKISKSILKSQQIFRGEKSKIFTEVVNKISLSANDDERIQSFNSI